MLFVLDTEVYLNIFSLPLHFLTKIKLFVLAITSTLLNLPPLQLTVFILIALLVGINIELMRQKVYSLSKQKHVKVAIGAGIISVAGAGCAACGFSFLSVIGIGSAAAFLPFNGLGLSVIALVILVITFYYNLVSFSKACKITR